MVGVKRHVVDLSEDEESSGPSSPASSSNKRPRYQQDAFTASRRRNDVRDGDNEDEYQEDAHQPGSLVRVTLRNFVTYTAAEFHPGPSLNMVIGPNGTGKSTLVCAICLGLGWDPKNLGRAKEIGEFVKHGSTEAMIEIELAAGENHDANPVLRRLIKKEGNKSAFFINGSQTTQKEVVKLAKSFAIQIDNLCQFLPQDRVVEFAGLSPIALLKETLRAAAPDQMVQWHEELINLRSDEKRLEVEQKTEDAALKQLQNRQNATREDVERWHQRQELVVKARALERCRPIIEKNLIRNQVENIKVEKRQARQELDVLQAEAEPAQAAQRDMEAYRRSVEDVRNQRKAHVEHDRQRADKFAKDIKCEQDAITEFANKVKAEKEGEKARRQDVKRLENSIASIERQMQDTPVEVDEAGYRERRSGLQENVLDAANRGREAAAKMNDLSKSAADMRAKAQTLVNERDLLDTQTGKLAKRLKDLSEDTATGWDWIQNNRHTLQLKGDIYGPPILTCSVTDPRYADIVEGQFGGVGDATAITFTNGDDQRLISNKLLGRDGLNLHQVTLRSVNQPLSYYRAPLTKEELQNLGFEGFILDYIEGPEPVLAMLCDSAKLHCTAYASTPLSEEQHENVTRSPISAWITGRSKYRVIRRREYGNASSTRVTTIPPAKYFTDQPVDDDDRKRRLDNEIREIKQDMQTLKEQYSELKKEADQRKEEQAQFKSELASLDEEYRNQQKARAYWEALPERKAEKQSELDQIHVLMQQTSNRVLEVKSMSETSALKAASLAIEYQKAVGQLRQSHESLVEAEIRLVEAISEVDSLKIENQHINQRIETLENTIRTLQTRKDALVKEYTRINRDTQRLLRTISEEEKVIMAEFSSLPTLEDLANEIEAVNTRLQLMAEGNPHAVQAYENREREIEQKESTLEKIAESLETTRAQIQGIRGQWEPELDKLVDQISRGFAHNFEQIGCAGQVGVHKDEDFEKWSIQIQVRFRENEQLSILDSQRQSGGERAVSTIFYLMALQDLARSPFRVVDEINQGMDPRNERMVHERMVDIACRERTSQYFLITPKLLSDLKFHPKMKIHCIASGEHMPDQYQKLDFQKLANIAIRRKMGVA